MRCKGGSGNARHSPNNPSKGNAAAAPRIAWPQSHSKVRTGGCPKSHPIAMATATRLPSNAAAVSAYCLVMVRYFLYPSLTLSRFHNMWGHFRGGV